MHLVQKKESTSVCRGRITSVGRSGQAEQGGPHSLPSHASTNRGRAWADLGSGWGRLRTHFSPKLGSVFPGWCTSTFSSKLHWIDTSYWRFAKVSTHSLINLTQFTQCFSNTSRMDFSLVIGLPPLVLYM